MKIVLCRFMLGTKLTRSEWQWQARHTLSYKHRCTAAKEHFAVAVQIDNSLKKKPRIYKQYILRVYVCGWKGVESYSYTLTYVFVEAVHVARVMWAKKFVNHTSMWQNEEFIATHIAYILICKYICEPNTLKGGVVLQSNGVVKKNFFNYNF